MSGPVRGPCAALWADRERASGAPVRVDVTWVSLEAWDPMCRAALDGVERAREAAYLHADDRRRFVLGAVTVRRIAAAFHGVAAQAVPVDRTCRSCGVPHGPPRIPRSPLRFAVTHSGDLVGVAVTHGVAVGLDVEACGDAVLDDAVVATVLSSDEARPRTLGQFLRVWTRKEATVKATGEGLTAGLHRVVVTPASAPAAVVSYVGRPLPCTVVDLSPRPDHPAAVCVLATARTDVVEHGPD